MENFKPPKDPALHALWVIRNWSQFPLGNMQNPEQRLRDINKLATEVFDRLHKLTKEE